MDIEFLARVVGASPATRVDPVQRGRGDGRGARAGDRASAGDVRARISEAFAVEVSAAGRARAADAESAPADGSALRAGGGSAATEEAPRRSGELSDEEQEEVRQLRKRDAEVRMHENAHKAAAGRHARGGPTYDYERGPDGRNYAVGGEVKIDTAPVPDDPDATIRKMRQVRRAAMAPAEPSPQDRRVAAEASQREQAARSEQQRARREDRAEGADAVEDRRPGRALRAYAASEGPRRGGFERVA